MPDKRQALTTISILGCGWLGSPLLRRLALTPAYALRGSGRGAGTQDAVNANGGKAFTLDLPTDTHALDDFLAGCDVLLVTLPPNGRRHGAATTDRYLAALQPLANHLDRLHLIYTSSTGVYGNANGLVTEATPPRPTTESGRAVLAAEQFFAGRTDRLTVLRLAGLVGPDRHPGRFYGGRDRPIPRADAPVNLVHRDDVISAVERVIERRLYGTFNVCAAAHPPKGDFYRAAAAHLGLPIAGQEAGGATDKKISAEHLRKVAGWSPAFDTGRSLYDFSG